MHEGKNPGQHERYGNDDEEVAHIDACRVGAEEDGPEGKDGNECGTQEGHCRTASDAGQCLHTRASLLHVNKYAVYDDDGIIHQHTHRQDECSEAHALQRAVESFEHKQRTKHDGEQAEADDDSGLEAHREDEDNDNDEHRLEQVDEECVEGCLDALGLVEDLLELHAHRHRLTKLRNSLLHLLADLHDVLVRYSCNRDAEGSLTVTLHLVACRIDITFIYPRHVSDAQLLVIVSLDYHVCDVVHMLEAVIDGYTDTMGAIVVVAGIGGAVLVVERLYDLNRHYAEVRHLVLSHLDVDALSALAVYLHSRHTVYVCHITFHQFGIVRHLLVGEPVGSKGIEHAIHVAEVVAHDWRGGCARERQCSVAHLAAQDVPVLLHVFVLDRCFQFYSDEAQVVHRLALYVIYARHLADGFLKTVGHFQFYFMCRSTGVGGHHHSLLHLDGRVFQLGHDVVADDASQDQDCHKERDKLAVIESPTGKIKIHSFLPFQFFNYSIFHLFTSEESSHVCFGCLLQFLHLLAVGEIAHTGAYYGLIGLQAFQHLYVAFEVNATDLN